MFVVRRASVALRPLARVGTRIPFPAVALSRSTVSARPFSSGLLTILKSEIKHEQEQEQKNEIDEEFLDTKKKVLKNFTLEDRPGISTLKLTRSFKDETIRVLCDMEDLAEDYGEEEDYEHHDDNEEPPAPEPKGINFEVEIVKGQQKLVFACVGGLEDLMIRRVQIFPEPENDQESYYNGPDFENLEEKLQEEYFNYLEERGVDRDMGYVLFGLAQEKEPKEYLNSLQKIAAFLGKN